VASVRVGAGVDEPQTANRIGGHVTEISCRHKLGALKQAVFKEFTDYEEPIATCNLV
jgi:hypothetical protein